MKQKRRLEQYQDMIPRLFPELSAAGEDGTKCLPRPVTFQVTDNCNLNCSYCYQINKGTRRMSFETAKKYVDMLLNATPENDAYINPVVSPAIILEFIGGEPLLEIELIDQIVDYFKIQAIEKMHPWATKYCISMCSNGVLYFDKKVQQFLTKHRNHLSFSITIDGNKELHDSCRVFPDGKTGSYDIAVAGAKDWISKGNYMGSKITIAPENLKYLYSAVTHMVELGYRDINANCVYEKYHATEFYYQLKKIADYLLGIDDDIYCSLFEENFFHPKEATDLDNWCGGNGMMLSCDPDGWLYPCIRYMESSLGTDVKPIRIGHVDTGIGATKCDRDCIKCVQSIDRRTQSTDECFYCPIAEGCSWCSAYNYQEFGTPDKRATYICWMHKARALANAYYWSHYYSKMGSREIFKFYMPDEWALKIIDQKELDMLKKLKNVEVCKI